MRAENTTYGTNRALDRLWSGQDNRVNLPNGNAKLRIQPVHRVHDALIGRFPDNMLGWALPKIRGYFDNPLKIGTIT
jgi:hypothetical protein